jgi:hypothetical protein
MLKKFLVYFTLAIFASHLIASLGSTGSTVELINMTGYGYALLTGTIVALSILYILPFVNIYLNKHFPWKSVIVKRIILQFLFGIVLPFILVMVLITGYYWIAGIWIMNTGWLTHCSTAIILMLFLVNIMNEVLADQTNLTETLTSKYNQEIQLSTTDKASLFRGRAYSDLVYINSENKKNSIMFTDGVKYPFPHSITFAMNLLPGKTHLKANRAQVIKLTSIKKAVWVDGKRFRIQVYLKEHESLEIIFSEVQTAIHKHLLRPYMGGVD